MEIIRKVMPVLWAIVERKKKCAVNVTTFEDKLTITILLGKRKKRFEHDCNIPVHTLITQLKAF